MKKYYGFTVQELGEMSKDFFSVSELAEIKRRAEAEQKFAWIQYKKLTKDHGEHVPIAKSLLKRVAGFEEMIDAIDRVVEGMRMKKY